MQKEYNDLLFSLPETFSEQFDENVKLTYIASNCLSIYVQILNFMQHNSVNFITVKPLKTVSHDSMCL